LQVGGFDDLLVGGGCQKKPTLGRPNEPLIFSRNASIVRHLAENFSEGSWEQSEFSH